MRKQWIPGALFPYLMHLGTRLTATYVLNQYTHGCEAGVHWITGVSGGWGGGEAMFQFAVLPSCRLGRAGERDMK